MFTKALYDLASGFVGHIRNLTEKMGKDISRCEFYTMVGYTFLTNINLRILNYIFFRSNR